MRTGIEKVKMFQSCLQLFSHEQNKIKDSESPSFFTFSLGIWSLFILSTTVQSRTISSSYQYVENELLIFFLAFMLVVTRVLTY